MRWLCIRSSPQIAIATHTNTHQITRYFTLPTSIPYQWYKQSAVFSLIARQNDRLKYQLMLTLTKYFENNAIYDLYRDPMRQVYFILATAHSISRHRVWFNRISLFLLVADSNVQFEFACAAKRAKYKPIHKIVAIFWK